MSDTITILRARGRRLCKTISADGTVHGYDSARTFDLAERQVASLADLHARLAELASQQDRCIVRGGIADPTRTRGVRRLLHADGDDPPTLTDVPRRWVALDIDGMPLPPNHEPNDLFSCGIAAVLTLPAEFRGVAFLVQATASHGRKPGAHLRIWTWLDRPATGAELAHWLRGVPHLDPASFRAAQPIFTAAPIFEAGADILPKRLELMAGPETVRVPPAEALRPAPPPPPKPPPDLGESRVARYAVGALRGASLRIRSAPVGGRHAAILAEARGLGRLVAAGTLPESAAISTIASAARGAGKVDETEISAALRWGFSHASPAVGVHADGR